MNYNEALKEKFAHFPQVKRISRHRQVPKHVYQAKKELVTIKDSKKRKYVYFITYNFKIILENIDLYTPLQGGESPCSYQTGNCTIRSRKTENNLIRTGVDEQNPETTVIFIVLTLFVALTFLQIKCILCIK